MEIIILCTTTLVVLLGTILYKKIVQIKQLETVNKNLLIKIDNSMSAKESKEIVDFIDSLLTVKFQYYLTSYILAYFVSDKEIDKKEIKKLKEDFYLDVSKTLCEQQQNRILKVFSKEGIILYIHQAFLRLLNDANVKFKNNDASLGNLSRRTLDAVYS